MILFMKEYCKNLHTNLFVGGYIIYIYNEMLKCDNEWVNHEERWWIFYFTMKINDVG